jgi:hypothetical protein
MQKIGTKNECVHKLNGKSLLIVCGQKGDNKFICKCASCGERIEYKKKRLPKDVQWAI